MHAMLASLKGEMKGKAKRVKGEMKDDFRPLSSGFSRFVSLTQVSEANGCGKVFTVDCRP